MSSLIKKEIIQDYAKFVSRGKTQFYTKNFMPLVIGKREGCYFYDIDGKKLLNFHCNGGVFNLGHSNSEVKQILIDALKNYDIGNHHLISSPRSLLAKKLSSLMPGNISKVVFGVSGGEAIDLAIKLARGYTKKNNIISVIGGYHGHTGFALAAGDEKFKKPFGKLAPGFIQVPYGNITAIKNKINNNTAAVLMETIPATLGIVIPPANYFSQLRKICDKHKIMLIIDEVQTGLSRTGKFLAIEEYNITPDIIVLGKGLSGGIYPITATCFKEKYDDFFLKHPFIHISTFGGSELGCFVALKVLEISANENYLKNINNIAEYFKQELTKIKNKYSNIFIEIRQKGLMMGLKFSAKEITMLLCKILYDNGLFAVFSGNDETVLQFLPPLVITKKEANEGLNILQKSILDLKNNLKYKAMLLALKFKNKSPI